MSILLKSAVLFALLMSAPVQPDTTSDNSPVPLVICRSGESLSAGSAFRIGPTLLLSVSHVVSNSNCAIDGKPIHPLYNNGQIDFAILEDAGTGAFLKVDCSGFVQGRMYLAIGHVRAADGLTAIPMIATGHSESGLAVLAGIMEVQPGMSGGPVIDAETHKVVGTVNAAEWDEGLSFSRELRGTSVCGGR